MRRGFKERYQYYKTTGKLPYKAGRIDDELNYADGKESTVGEFARLFRNPGITGSIRSKNLQYDPNDDTYLARFPFEVNVTGINRKPKSHVPHMHIQKTPITTGEVLGGMIEPMRFLSPTNDVRAVYDAVRYSDSALDFGRRLFLPNPGIVTHKFEEEHPYLSMAANTIGDAAIGGAINTGSKIMSAGGFAIANKNGTSIRWVPINRRGGVKSQINLGNTFVKDSDGKRKLMTGVDWVLSGGSGEGRKLYDAAIKLSHKQGGDGIVTGNNLFSADKTNGMYQHYPNKVLLNNDGTWKVSPDLPYLPDKISVNNMEDFLKNTPRGHQNYVEFDGAPVYRLGQPSQNVPLFTPFLTINRAKKALLNFGNIRLKPSLRNEADITPRGLLNDEPLIARGTNDIQPPYQIQEYPGYQLRSLMRGNPLEKQLSKTGTIGVNNIKAQAARGSNVEKAVIDKVLASEQFAGQKSIDYNAFRKAVQDELITYERFSDTRYNNYGMDRLGYHPKQHSEIRTDPRLERFTDEFGEGWRFVDNGRLLGDIDSDEPWWFENYPELNTFTFESPRIPVGNANHYDPTTLGHSRTYTTTEEPDILHVMESQSDWGQHNVSAPYTGTSSYLNDLKQYREFIDGHKRLLKEFLQHPEEYMPGSVEDLIKNIEHHESVLRSMIEGFSKNTLAKYLHDNYTYRQIQENLKYAAENGQTKMRYPTPETAAKIEGYQRLSPSWELIEALAKKYNRPEGYVDLGTRENLVDFESLPEKEALELSERFKIYEKWDESQLAKDFWEEFNNIGDYYPQHQTILKKYADFPKLFKKLWKDLEVRTVTDTRGNTWYEVDVPKNFLKREWMYGITPWIIGGGLAIPSFTNNK